MWHELRQFGATILDAVLVEEAQLVCDEMARRARHNINLIVERLANDGYRFHSNDERRPLHPRLSGRLRARGSTPIGYIVGSVHCR